MSDEIMSLKGTNGLILAYEDRVVVSRKSFLGYVAQGINPDRTYYYRDLLSIDFQKPNIVRNGYMRFVVVGTADVKSKVNLRSPNTLKDSNIIVFHAFGGKKKRKKAVSLYALVMQKMTEARRTTVVSQMATPSGADETAKYKKLFDDGVITIDEFEQKKKQLLGLS